MQRKLKSVFRRSIKSRASSVDKPKSSASQAEASLPCGDRYCKSPDRHGRTSVDGPMTGSIYSGRSGPINSIQVGSRQSQPSAKHTVAADFASSDPNDGATANDYMAYVPALSPGIDNYSNEETYASRKRHHIARNNKELQRENVADCDITRRSTSIDGGRWNPTDIAHHGLAGATLGTHTLNPKRGSLHLREQSINSASIGSNLSPVSSGGSVGKYTVGNGITTNRDLVDGIRSHSSSHEKISLKRLSSSAKTAGVETEHERRKPRLSGGDSNESLFTQETCQVKGARFGVHHATIDGTAEGKERDLAEQLREEGVVDLRNTVDTDGDITWAPAVIHETIKPHQHEIIQQKIYREIHNYEYFHRIQPVTVTEVLPPRHWIPNPKGEGLIEISADELPARTGENRWWSICEHSSPYALQKTPHKYRTEPEIIEAGTFMTEEGFERKETIIVHPPTLADLTGYTGPVQTVHFDHKTGKRWVGELTTMDKLHELQQTLDHTSKPQMFQMDGLAESLPKAPSNSMPLRKPVSGHSSAVHSSNVGRKINVA